MQGIDAEVIVIDNNSKDDSCEMVKMLFPRVILIENKDNKGFSKANNQGVAIAKGEYILFLNPDTVMPEDFLTKTLDYMDKHPKAGALGPRLIDGKGVYAPDAKKSFPSLSVAIFKTTGINKLFSKSPYFNKYYAVHIAERATAPIEVLSGCCMLVRSVAMQEAGGPFDEDYFMYCEDVDLSYRILKAGYENIYYPEVDLIHYKGESTKKMTLSYVRIFNEALVTFVKKHYSKKDAQLFVFFINVGIALRAILGTIKRGLKILHMPLVDAFILFGVLWVMKDFWVNKVIGAMPIPLSSVYATFPVYILLWLVTMYLNSVYDNPYRALKVTRGMAIGTTVILAFYGLLPPELRYSRAIIILSGLVSTGVLLGMHEILYKLGILKYIPFDKLPKKAIIVGSEEHYIATSTILQKVHYAPEIVGRVSIDDEKGNALAHIGDLKQLLYVTDINEVIFCINGLSYQKVFSIMQECGKDYEYKIHLPGSQSFVGSNSSSTSGDLYILDRSYNLSYTNQLRNKRMLDISVAFILLLLTPVLFWKIKRPINAIKNCFLVLIGQKTWISYAPNSQNKLLPNIRPGVLPPFNILAQFEPSDQVTFHINMAYAQHYSSTVDMNLILKNLAHMGN